MKPFGILILEAFWLIFWYEILGLNFYSDNVPLKNKAIFDPLFVKQFDMQ